MACPWAKLQRSSKPYAMGRFNGNPYDGSTSPRNRGRCARSDCPTGHRNSCRKSSACSWKRITNRSSVATHTDFDLDGDATPHCERYGPSGQVQSGSWRAIYRAALTRWITSYSCLSCVKASTMSSSSLSSADYSRQGIWKAGNSTKRSVVSRRAVLSAQCFPISTSIGLTSTLNRHSFHSTPEEKDEESIGNTNGSPTKRDITAERAREKKPCTSKGKRNTSRR